MIIACASPLFVRDKSSPYLVVNIENDGMGKRKKEEGCIRVGFSFETLAIQGVGCCRISHEAMTLRQG